MKTIDKYPSFTEELISDPFVQKYSGMVLKHGFKGALKKACQVSMALDAACVWMDTCGRYVELTRQREITRQLQQQNRLLKQQYDHALQLLRLEYAAVLEAGENRYKLLQLAVQQQQQDRDAFMLLLAGMRDHAAVIHQLLCRERENGLQFSQLSRMQSDLDALIRSLLRVAITSLDDSGN